MINIHDLSAEPPFQKIWTVTLKERVSVTQWNWKHELFLNNLSSFIPLLKTEKTLLLLLFLQIHESLCVGLPVRLPWAWRNAAEFGAVIGDLSHQLLPSYGRQRVGVAASHKRAWKVDWKPLPLSSPSFCSVSPAGSPPLATQWQIGSKWLF